MAPGRHYGHLPGRRGNHRSPPRRRRSRIAGASVSDISMSGKLPKGDGNGLVAILSELVRDTGKEGPIFVAVALIDGKKVTLDRDTGEKVPQVRVRRIEVILDTEDMRVCRRLMERSLTRRTGQEVLPYDLENEITEVFGDKTEADYREPRDNDDAG
jgi:hypothetical protein